MGLMRDAGARRLVDQSARIEAAEIEGRREFVMPAGGEKMGQQKAARRDGLEAAGPPAAVQMQPVDRRRADDRAVIPGDVDDARPLAQQLEAPEARKQLREAGDDVLGDRQIAALRVGGIEVEAGAEHHLALSVLAYI